MKTIYKLARTELQTLFYSPIAWLIIVVFTFQVAMVFAGKFAGFTQNQALGYGLQNVTLDAFTANWGGLFPAVQGYLYLYIPLLTMGLMSRELGSGSIKLLYSSPITNTQIILGKYLSMMLYGLILIGILVLFVIFSAFTVENFDLPPVLSGLLGLYLLICAYAAIGLFMSSLTSYQVVAAICTLVMLSILRYVGSIWQDIAFVRDITYWLSISGRSDEFIRGLICSEDVLYFIIVVALFLWLTIIRLQACRQKSAWTVTWGKYLGVFCVAMFLGYFSSRPTLMGFYDTTRMKVNTLTPISQDIIKRLEGGVTITAYTNLFDSRDLWTATPRSVNHDKGRFKQYTRFKPEIKMKYEYYYDTIPGADILQHYEGETLEDKARKLTEIVDMKFQWFQSGEEMKNKIDLLPESNTFIREIEWENGEKIFLRVFDDNMHQPTEREISAAMKRLVMELPKVGFIHGHGERDNNREGDRNYRRFAQDKPFRHSLVNQGFEVTNVTLDKKIPEDIHIIVIAEMKSGMTEIQKENLDEYIERGGNLFILCEPRRNEFMEPLVNRFGVQLVPGMIVNGGKDYLPNFIVTRSTPEAGELSYPFMGSWRYAYVTMPGVAGLEYVGGEEYTVTPLFKTDSLCWNELETVNFEDDTVSYNPEMGEIQKTYTTGLALSRSMNGKEQRIVILGDADCISNGEISISRQNIWAENYAVVNGTFFWLSNGEVPIDVRRPSPTDNKVYLNQDQMAVWDIVFRWGIPVLLALVGIVIWVRRKGR